MVEVFKTNVTEQLHAANLLALLTAHLPEHQINFDLSDCDNILRVKGGAVPVNKIIELVSSNGFECTVLD